MKNVLTFTLLLFVFSLTAQSTLRGTLRSTSGDPIAYANIGVLDGNSGTVSDYNGNFALTLKKADVSKTLRISAIGFVTKDIDLKTLNLQEPLRVQLQEEVYELAQVEVDAKKYKKTKVLGNKSDNESVIANFSDNLLGTELGIHIKVKKKEVWIKEARFNIAGNKLDTLVFRVNVYDMADQQIGEKLLQENVIVETNMRSGQLVVDLRDFNLIATDDILLSLELLEHSSTEDLEGALSFCANLFKGPLYMRSTSQADWHVEGKAGLLKVGVGFNVLASF